MNDMKNDNKPWQKPGEQGVGAPQLAKGLDKPSGTPKASDETSILGKVGAFFDSVLQRSRGSGQREAPVELHGGERFPVEDLAVKRTRNATPQRMVVPEGTIITGSTISGSDTEISGRVEGDVAVDGRLYLGSTAVVTGNVRAISCKLEGLVEGKMECSQEIELGRTGRLNSDASAGKRISVAGQVFGSMTTNGMLRLASTGKIEGNIHARQLVIEEGAVFNGACSMKVASQRNQI